MAASDLLELVEAAIERRLAGLPVDEKTVNGRSLKFTPLPDLWRLRKELQAEVSATATGRGRNYASFRRPD